MAFMAAIMPAIISAVSSLVSVRDRKNKEESARERKTDIANQELARQLSYGDQLYNVYKPNKKDLDILSSLESLFKMPGEKEYASKGPLSKELLSSLLSALTTSEYEPTLDDQIELARQSINARENQSGFFSSGRRFEDVGRAASELAVRSAEGKLAERQQARSNAFQLANYINQMDQNSRQSFLDFQNNLRSREMAGATGRAELASGGSRTKAGIEAGALDRLYGRADQAAQRTWGLEELATKFLMNAPFFSGGQVPISPGGIEDYVSGDAPLPTAPRRSLADIFGMRSSGIPSPQEELALSRNRRY